MKELTFKFFRIAFSFLRKKILFFSQKSKKTISMVRKIKRITFFLLLCDS